MNNTGTGITILDKIRNAMVPVHQFFIKRTSNDTLSFRSLRSLDHFNDMLFSDTLHAIKISVPANLQ